MNVKKYQADAQGTVTYLLSKRTNMRDCFYLLYYPIALLQSLALPDPMGQASRPPPKLIFPPQVLSSFQPHIPTPKPPTSCAALGTTRFLKRPFWPQKPGMWLPPQHIDVPVAAGGGKTELHVELARNLQEDGDAG